MPYSLSMPLLVDNNIQIIFMYKYQWFRRTYSEIVPETWVHSKRNQSPHLEKKTMSDLLAGVRVNDHLFFLKQTPLRRWQQNQHQHHTPESRRLTWCGRDLLTTSKFDSVTLIEIYLKINFFGWCSFEVVRKFKKIITPPDGGLVGCYSAPTFI